MNSRLLNQYSAALERREPILDKYGRIMSYSVHGEDFSHPYLSEYLKMRGFETIFPEEKKFAVVLSHDIDVLYKSPTRGRALKNFGKGLYKADYRLASNSVSSLFRKSVWHEFDLTNILKIEQQFKAHSTFFLLALDPEDASHNYDVGHETDLINKVLNAGNEIGLHGSFHAFDDYNAISTEKKRLETAINAPVLGYRNHNLNFDLSKTWKLLIKAGFKYDATFGFPDRPGFRNGLCHPFLPYDYDSNSPLPIIEFPLHIMDTTLFRYMNLSNEQALRYINKIAEQVYSNRGVLSLLWHNDGSGERDSLYSTILQNLSDTGAWFPTMSELSTYFTKSGYLEELWDHISHGIEKSSNARK